MAANKVYVALGVEATRGTAESSTVGFLPVTSTKPPELVPEDQRYNEYRGQESSLGEIGTRRMATSWKYSLEMNVFTESGGGSKAMVANLIKHFMGFCGSSQNGSTGQYLHMMYPVFNPTSVTAGYLGTKALTVNFNQSEGDTVKNHAWEGGLVTGLVFTQEQKQPLKLTVNMIGQKKQATGTAISTPTYAAENLLCDYHDLLVYTGTITRTGTGPNFTQFAFGSATAVYPFKVTLTLENGKVDEMVFSGTPYPNKQMMGQFKATLVMDFDFSDPAAGFSSVDEVNNFLAGIAQTNFFLYWNTGTQAETGDTHGIYIDLPVMINKGGIPEFSKESDPRVSLTYEADMDETTAKYLVGIMMKNTATAI